MKYNPREIYTKSNLLSLLRLFLAVPLWILLDNFQSAEIRYITVAVCLFASVTDILDGYLARRFNEVTELGRVIDPLADKVAIAAVIVKLFLIGQIPTYYFVMIIARDGIIFFGGLIVAQKLGRVLPSNMLGKITVINIGIVILLILFNIDKSNLVFGIFYYLSIFLIIASLIGYSIRAYEFLKRKKDESI